VHTRKEKASFLRRGRRAKDVVALHGRADVEVALGQMSPCREGDATEPNNIFSVARGKKGKKEGKEEESLSPDTKKRGVMAVQIYCGCALQ